jgi:protease IV
MSNSRMGRVGRALRWLWWLLDASRRVLMNLLMLLLLATLAWYALRTGAPPLHHKTALVLALRGPLHEQFSGNLRDNALRQARGLPVEQTRLRDVLAALDAAAKDDRIERAVLVLDDFAGAGLPTLREVAAAIDRFKASGKQVVAWGTGYDQRQYYLAAHASEVWLDPMGEVSIEGYGGRRTYYKSALDRLGVTVHVLRVGQYKNAAENFVTDGPSPQTMQEDSALYGALWASYTAGVERARQLPAGSIEQALDALPERLEAAGGDSARLALQSHWVDALKTRDEMRRTLIERGARDDDNRHTFRQIPFESYLATVRPPSGADAVGVVVAEGDIVDGEADGGTIGGLSTAELIRQAREDEHIKAIVLRVDSPGGSAFGAELVRRELALTRKAGKPVIVSMGDLAASGGYWISTAADEVIADPDTITGSIGVIAVLPSAEQGLAKIGVHTGGYTTGWLVDAYDLRSGLDPRYRRLLQAGIDHTYDDFVAKVAAARKSTPEKIDAVAQGRVWTGAQALQRGLVDKLGSFEDAIAAAEQRAHLPATTRVQYIEREPGRVEQLLSYLGVDLAAFGGSGAGWLGPLGLPAPASLQKVQQDLGWLAGAGDVADGRKPFVTLTHCMCRAP